MIPTHMIPLQNVRQTLLELPWNSLVSQALIFDSQKFSAKNILLRDDESKSCLNTFFGLSVSTFSLPTAAPQTCEHFRCRRSSITSIFWNYIGDFIDRERIICLLLFKQLYRLNLHVGILSSPCHKANGSGIEMERYKIIAQQSIGSSFVRIAGLAEDFATFGIKSDGEISDWAIAVVYWEADVCRICKSLGFLCIASLQTESDLPQPHDPFLSKKLESSKPHRMPPRSTKTVDANWSLFTGNVYHPTQVWVPLNFMQLDGVVNGKARSFKVRRYTVLESVLSLPFTPQRRSSFVS